MLEIELSGSGGLKWLTLNSKEIRRRKRRNSFIIIIMKLLMHILFEVIVLLF